MGKRKCKFKDEAKSKHSFSRNGRDEWEAECLTCKPGTSVSSSSRKLLGVEKSLAKATSFFTASGSKSEDDALEPEGASVFHTVKHSSSYTTAHYTSFQFKTTFPDFEIAPKFQVRRKRQK